MACTPSSRRRTGCARPTAPRSTIAAEPVDRDFTAAAQHVQAGRSGLRPDPMNDYYLAADHGYLQRRSSVRCVTRQLLASAGHGDNNSIGSRLRPTTLITACNTLAPRLSQALPVRGIPASMSRKADCYDDADGELLPHPRNRLVHREIAARPKPSAILPSSEASTMNKTPLAIGSSARSISAKDQLTLSTFSGKITSLGERIGRT